MTDDTITSMPRWPTGRIWGESGEGTDWKERGLSPPTGWVPSSIAFEESDGRVIVFKRKNGRVGYSMAARGMVAAALLLVIIGFCAFVLTAMVSAKAAATVSALTVLVGLIFFKIGMGLAERDKLKI